MRRVGGCATSAQHLSALDLSASRHLLLLPGQHAGRHLMGEVRREADDVAAVREEVVLPREGRAQLLHPRANCKGKGRRSEEKRGEATGHGLRGE